MDAKETGAALNERWEKRITDAGADFALFVDAAALPGPAAQGYGCAVLFGKALSREYLAAMREGREPRTKEVINTERKMDALGEKLAGWLADEGYRAVGKLKTGLLPHKTVALRAGLGFIGKNNLLVTKRWGCGLMLGRVLTDAPFAVTSAEPMEPMCGGCTVCADSCPTGALLGERWSVDKKREDIITRAKCTLCLRCMVCCPYTRRYEAGEA